MTTALLVATLVFVSTERSGTVTVHDRRRERPWNVALTADGARLYTANGVSNDVSVVDTRTGKVIRTIKAGDGPWVVAISSRTAGPSVRRSPRARRHRVTVSRDAAAPVQACFVAAIGRRGRDKNLLRTRAGKIYIPL